MSILKQLQENKGALSSALGKSLAEQVLKGEKRILKEAVELINHDNKNVRAGAAKIIEMVAEKKPEFIADHMKKLKTAFDAPEAQTRWMIIRTFGLCANLNPKAAEEALAKAKIFLKEDSGACLWNRTMIYLGYLGAVSEKYAQKAFPILEKAFTSVPKQENAVLEAVERMIPVLDGQTKTKVQKFAEKHSKSSKSNIKTRATKIIKKLKK